MLLKAGARVDAIEMFGRTPLFKAVSEDGRLQKAKMLLEHGANPNLCDIQGKWNVLQVSLSDLTLL